MIYTICGIGTLASVNEYVECCIVVLVYIVELVILIIKYVLLHSMQNNMWSDRDSNSDLLVSRLALDPYATGAM